MEKFEWRHLDTDELKWLAVDFDETLAKNSGYPDFTPGEPVEGAVEAMKKLNNLGWKIIIHTARHWSDYSGIENWLNFYKIPFRRIVCGKLMARYYIDDRAIGFRGDWNSVLKGINESLDN